MPALSGSQNHPNQKRGNAAHSKRFATSEILAEVAIIQLPRGRFLLLTAALASLTGCGVATVRHVRKFAAISGDKMSDLHGRQPIEVKSGQCSAAETTIGTAGMGKVVGNLAEWTGVTVEAVKANLSVRGATLTAGAPKSLTIGGQRCIKR